MRFSVWWNRRALDSLAQLWMDFPAQREGINQAVATTDKLLKVDPETQGESRDAGRRIVFVPPLVVLFRVIAERSVVRVLDVRIIRRRGES